MCDVEKILADSYDEVVSELTKNHLSPKAKAAWYWTYIGGLDMLQQLGLINDERRQQLYQQVAELKP